jgi:hypothetical protein
VKRDSRNGTNDSPRKKATRRKSDCLGIVKKGQPNIVRRAAQERKPQPDKAKSRPIATGVLKQAASPPAEACITILEAKKESCGTCDKQK